MCWRFSVELMSHEHYVERDDIVSGVAQLVNHSPLSVLVHTVSIELLLLLTQNDTKLCCDFLLKTFLSIGLACLIHSKIY